MADLDLYQGAYSGPQIDSALAKVIGADATPTANSQNMVTSGGVKSALDAKVSGYGTRTNVTLYSGGTASSWTAPSDGMVCVALSAGNGDGKAYISDSTLGGYIQTLNAASQDYDFEWFAAIKNHSYTVGSTDGAVYSVTGRFYPFSYA